jgi:hypothetical protein
LEHETPPIAKVLLAVRAFLFDQVIGLLFDEFVAIETLFCLSFYKIRSIRDV